MVKKIHSPPRAPKSHKSKVHSLTAVVMLLVITIAASGGAFLWLNKIKVGELGPGCDDPSASFCIQKINYDRATNNLLVWLFNKDESGVSILKDASAKDQTRFSIFTSQGTLDNCVFQPLDNLKCDATAGLCEGIILPGSSAVLALKGGRSKCVIDNYELEYWLRIDFKEDTVRKQFIPL